MTTAMAHITKQDKEKHSFYHGYVAGQNKHMVVHKDNAGQDSVARKSVRVPPAPALTTTKLPLELGETKLQKPITINVHSSGGKTNTVRAVIVASQVTIDICSSLRMLPQSNRCVAKIKVKPEFSGIPEERLYKEVVGEQGKINRTAQEICLSEELRQGEQSRTAHYGKLKAAIHCANLILSSS